MKVWRRPSQDGADHELIVAQPQRFPQPLRVVLTQHRLEHPRVRSHKGMIIRERKVDEPIRLCVEVRIMRLLQVLKRQCPRTFTKKSRYLEYF